MKLLILIVVVRPYHTALILMFLNLNINILCPCKLQICVMYNRLFAIRVIHYLIESVANINSQQSQKSSNKRNTICTFYKLFWATIFIFISIIINLRRSYILRIHLSYNIIN